MKVIFYGGAGSVTGSNYLVEHEGSRILVDCGLRQGGNFCERLNWEPFAYDPGSIEAVLVTHAHIDHTGRLPKLVRDGFTGTVYATPPTREAAEFLLADSDHILEMTAQRFKKPILYNHEDIMQLMSQWKSIDYHKSVDVGPFHITFYNAGHILGSSFITIEADDKKLVFSGDLGNSPAPLLPPTETITDATHVLIESTYGSRVHEDKPKRKALLQEVILDTVKRGGTLMIPAFAMERTQELLYELNDLIEKKQIPSIPMFLDSPLAIRLTGVFRNNDAYLSHSAETPPGTDPGHLFKFPKLKETMRTEESKGINNVPSPKVIIAGSGMSNAGRILHHEKRYLSDPNSTLLIIGYQAKGSLGRQLLDGAKTVKIHHQEVPVRAHLKAIGGYSAHADQPQLLNWLRPMQKSLKKVFVVQGEEDQSEAFAKKAKEDLGLNTYIPVPNEEVVL